MVAAGFAAVGIGSAAPTVTFVAALGAVVALHAAWRLRRTPSSILESVVIDGLASTLAIAALGPTALVVVLMTAILGLQSLLYLPARQASWTMSGVIVGMAAAQWGFNGSVGSADTIPVALVGAIAVLPIVAWLVERTAEVARQLEATSAALEVSARRFERLFDQAPMPHFRSTADGELLDANPALLTMFGASSIAEINREPLSKRYADAEGRGRFVDLIQRHGEVTGIEAQMLRLDGTAIWCRVSAILTTDARGNAVMEGVIEDVTALRESNLAAHYGRFLLDEVPAAVIGIDQDGFITFWSNGAELLCGWPKNEVIGRVARDILVTPALVDTAGEVAFALQVEGLWEGEIDVGRKDGSVVRCSASAKLLPEGDLPGGAVIVFTDISDRALAEAEARLQGELARSVLESVAVPMAVVGDDGTIRAVNRAWTDFAGANGGDLDEVGVGADYLGVTAAASDESATAALRGIEEVLRGDTDRFAMEYECHAPDEERWFRMEATPIPQMGAVVAHWNVTEERKARAALQGLIAQKDEFIAAVSHELRTPLTTVVGLAAELTNQQFEERELAEFHRLIADQSQEVAHIVEDLLVAARADTDTLAVHTAPFDLVEAVDAVVGVYRDASSEKIRVADPGFSGLAIADGARVRQILRNLIANALRHGSPPIEVEVGRSPTGPTVSIIDHGTGIPLGSIDRLFQPYARFSDLPGQPSSVGLGLYVSQRLAALMGGSLEYARRGSTTVFTLSLPGIHHESAVA